MKSTKDLANQAKNPHFIKTRSLLKNNIDVILNNISAYRQSLKNEAEDLFATTSDNNNSKILAGLNTKAENLPKFKLLLAEKESLGIYISGNPLEQYVDILNWVRETAQTENLHLVLIEKIRKIFTKASQMMIAVEISVVGEPLEMIIFPKNALRLSPLLEEKKVYWVSGQIKVPKSLFVNKKKPENSPETENIEKTESTEVKKEFEMKEYQEISKLAVDNLVAFEQGPMPILEMDRLTQSRQKALKEVVWEKLLLKPELFYKENTKEVQNQQGVAFEKVNNQTPIEQDSEEPLVLKLPSSFGHQKLAKLKTYLLSEQIAGTTPVCLQVEHQGNWKKVKGVFYIEKPIAQLILDNKFE
jgi:DNA polymerase III alpha subunit